MKHKNASSSNSNRETDVAYMSNEHFIAAVKGYEYVVRKDEPMEYNLQCTRMGNTVLHILATYGHSELAYMICQKYPSLWSEQNKMQETPFHCAAKAGHGETISKLIEFASSYKDQLISVLREKNKRGETALREAARWGYGSVVSKLMEVDPSLACQFNDDGVSPLYLASARINRNDDNTVVAEMLKQLSNPVFSDGRNKKTTFEAPLQSVGNAKKISI